MGNPDPKLHPENLRHDGQQSITTLRGTRKWKLELSRIIDERGDLLHVDANGVPDPDGRTNKEVAIDNAWRVASSGNDKNAIVALKVLGELGYERPNFKDRRTLALAIVMEAMRLGIKPEADPVYGPLLESLGYTPALSLITDGSSRGDIQPADEGTGSPDSPGMDAEELS